VARILLVEDDDLLLDMARQHLELLDHQVTGAGNGAEALEQARAGTPDLILMDVGMPVLDGYEATRRLKADPATRAIPVIVLTAFASREDAAAALAAGADDYESKPIDFDRLSAKIDTLLLRKDEG
jgi:CheY-like chemotaxis protein